MRRSSPPIKILPTMTLFRQFHTWVVKTKFLNFAVWTAGIVLVGFLFTSSMGAMNETDALNAESARINAGISQARCAAIEEQCALKAKADSDFATTHGLTYNPSNQLICVWESRKAAGIECDPRKIYSWPEVYKTYFFTSDALGELLLFWVLLFFAFAALKLISNEKNKGWVRLSVVSALGISIFSAFNLWHYYSDNELFVGWLGFSLLGLIMPIAAKHVFYWIKNGFNEDKPAEAKFAFEAEVPVDSKIEMSTNDDASFANRTDEQKLLPASFWDRFFARCIDLPIAIIIVAVVSLFIPEFPEEGQFKPLWLILNIGVSMVVLCLVLVLWDAFWISRYGATPGKMLLGLIIKDKNGEIPSWKTAKTRATAFLGHGLYYTFFFPALQILGAVNAWRRREGVQPWDGILGTQVLQGSIGWARRLGIRVFAVLLIISTVLVMQITKQVYKQQMRDQILQQYIK